MMLRCGASNTFIGVAILQAQLFAMPFRAEDNALKVMHQDGAT
jgi:hypothetical protein